MDDPFSYSARWDSAGLDCAFCKHERKVEWPNLNRDYGCNLHSISLEKELGKDGFKEGEWFCSSFHNNGKATPQALKELESIIKELKPNRLYGAYGANKQLKEIPFVEL